MADIIKKSIGKDTLGGGEKMNVELKTYNRSTHDLSKVWRNTQSVGTLVPYLCMLSTPGDIIDIDLDTDVLTHPTVGPLFGSFKLQLDVFSVPVRLYNAWLHNNRLGIGMDMKKIKLPLLKVELNRVTDNPDLTNEWNQINPSCLLNYLGQKGYGTVHNDATGTLPAEVNAIPLIGYWDIYKNYYANKQEQYGYMIGVTPTIDYIIAGPLNNPKKYTELLPNGHVKINRMMTTNDITKIEPINGMDHTKVIVEWRRLDRPDEPLRTDTLDSLATWTLASANWIWSKTYQPGEQPVVWSIYNSSSTEIEKFELDNIDEFRDKLMQAPGTAPYYIDKNNTLQPYLGFTQRGINGYLKTRSPQYGLALKTYQSDKFNNWINTEWIDGKGGINEITAIDTSKGSFKLDTLNLAKKVYDMLNRIAVSGGTYQDWIETVYSNEYIQRTETPMFEGGIAEEIVFQEVISQAATNEEPLGSLAGRGKLSGKKRGGSIVIKTTEPSYIIGLCSITPRLDYAQGNEFYVHHKTLDDLHKPALDGIGFQELNTDSMHYADAYIDKDGFKLKSIGKQPAWIDYMTNFNTCHGNFAINGNEAFMVLNRNYERDLTAGAEKIKDATTYIDPKKYNYIFADTSIDAMNFWVQVGMKITARRKMSAKIIPNL